MKNLNDFLYDFLEDHQIFYYEVRVKSWVSKSHYCYSFPG